MEGSITFWNSKTELESILANPASSFDELTYVWSEWRKVAAKPMRPDYVEYVELSNEAAKANGIKRRTIESLDVENSSL